MSENFAQFARFLVLREMWEHHIDLWAKNPGQWIERTIESTDRHPDAPFADAGSALRRIAEAGVDPTDIGAVARMVAYDATFGTLYVIDEGGSSAAGEDAPGWRLLETDANGRVTGRDVAGLHEDILTMDPSGREGRRP